MFAIAFGFGNFGANVGVVVGRAGHVGRVVGCARRRQRRLGRIRIWWESGHVAVTRLLLLLGIGDAAPMDDRVHVGAAAKVRRWEHRRIGVGVGRVSVSVRIISVSVAVGRIVVAVLRCVGSAIVHPHHPVARARLMEEANRVKISRAIKKSKQFLLKYHRLGGLALMSHVLVRRLASLGVREGLEIARLVRIHFLAEAQEVESCVGTDLFVHS